MVKAEDVARHLDAEYGTYIGARVSQELHRAVKLAAMERRIRMDEAIVEALIEKYGNERQKP